MPLYDYACEKDHVMEVRCTIADRPDRTPCATCGAPARRVLLEAPKQFSVIVPDYPGSKRLKAGYVHHLGDKSATRVTSGYGGALNPSSRPKNPLMDHLVKPEVQTPRTKIVV
jgi:putative FmdB family regulatory protein